MTDPAQIAASLSDAQRRALLECAVMDVCVGAGIAVAFIKQGLLAPCDILGDSEFVQLSPLGLAVRAELKRLSTPPAT